MRAEIVALKDENNKRVLKLLEQFLALQAQSERLKAIEQAAEKAYRYHMLGYKDATEFNANVMLDLMNELGAVL
ncbi:MAG: hypothetical protein ABWY64_25765 [Tardiphaga sp.]